MATKRIGRWLFAAHPFFTWRPAVEDFDECGWSIWWLWFEVAYDGFTPPSQGGTRP